MSAGIKNPYLEALAWHLDAGADEAVQDVPNDRTANFPMLEEPKAGARSETELPAMPAVQAEIRGRAESAAAAAEAARTCRTLDELKATIAAFDGLAIRRTASNLVFAAGHPEAKIMVIGDAPGGDDDRQGVAFSGQAGALLDKILSSIGLGRETGENLRPVYLTNLLNWRPPGNRSPSPSEIELSLPFLERHIALVKPERLILLGGTAAGALFGSTESISKLRGRFHNYRPRTPDISENTSAVPAIVTYHPVTLLQSPVQKRHVWTDMQLFRDNF